MINVGVNAKETGKKIRKLMDLRGLNVVAIREACGLESTQAIYKWLRGDSMPSIDNLVVLRSALDVSIDDILVCDDWDGEVLPDAG